MTVKYFRIKDGLSQQAREFPELAKGFFAVDSTPAKSILEMMNEYARKHGFPHFFDNVDVSKVISMINGEADGKTEPAAALYAVCAKLMGHVQNKLNELPDERIDFYYRKILKEDNLDAKGDRAFVTLEVDEDNVSCVLPKGTRFGAGENSKGENIEFESISDVNINDVKVAKILTVSNLDDYPVTQSEIPVYKVSQAIEQKMQPYPLFGLTRSNEMLDGTEFSKVGVCISNRIFCMSSGVRNVKVNFFYESKTAKKAFLDKQEDYAGDLSTAFSNAFSISLTTKEGWLNIENYKLSSGSLSSGESNNLMKLEFTLKDTDPPIVNYDPEIHGGGYRAKHPVLRLLVNPRKSDMFWFFFKNVQLQTVRIAVGVSKCRDIAVSNEFGPASMDLPVQPFGAVPSVGSSFIVGCKEICGKDIGSFTVHGKWCGLPNCSDFSEWYAQYENPPHTSDYTVSLSGLYGGTWYPSENKAITCKLFDTSKKSDLERKANGISPDFDISFSSIVNSHTSEIIPDDDNFMYSPMMKDGFFKMTLIAPSKAFMHGELSKTFCNSFLSQVLKKKTADNFPNPPYTPSIENLYVDYTADAEAIFASNDLRQDDGIFFIHPFGFSEKEKFVLHSGYLYLGLTFSGKPKKVNLYFLVNRDSAMRSSGNEKCEWSYLGPLGWTSLPDENRLADSTANFTSSGIVTLNLPSDMVNDDPLMPKGYYWIRIEPCNESWRECSRLLTVFSQSLEVRRVCGFEDGTDFVHCKPHTINELVKSVAGISKVYQFEESFGGKSPETDFKMRTRTAEFLYHRNRCVSSEDYERIILENFPEVLKVKCFAHTKINEETGFVDCMSPRNMLIVPISPLFDDGSFQWDPCLSGSLLREIRMFLRKFSSGISNIQVRNPFFEKLQVRCNVSLRPCENEGEIILDLNEKINQFLSPWYPKAGGITKHFGWSLENSVLKSFIENIDYVEKVGDDFTLMKIACLDDRKFWVHVLDKPDDKVFFGSFPWSVAVPMRKHFIDVKTKEIYLNEEVNNGYGALEIGQTFIIRKS